jgi:hypothetical protein
MINCILGLWTLGSIEILVIFLMPVVLIIVLLRWFIRNKKENIRLRLEVGKLADEIEKMRK